MKWFESEVDIGKETYEYKNGKLFGELSECVLSKKILSAHARGGWGMMNYIVCIESYEPPISFEEYQKSR